MSLRFLVEEDALNINVKNNAVVFVVLLEGLEVGSECFIRDSENIELVPFKGLRRSFRLARSQPAIFKTGSSSSTFTAILK
jgi:hypothetical protein